MNGTMMKKLMIGLLTCVALAQIGAAEADWLTDLAKAKETAKAEKKLVLIDFTGSDWCGWCIKFKKEVLSTQEFAEYAKKNLVLVELDFPQKIKQSAALKQANEKLKEQHKVAGFPTFVVLNSAGNEVGRQEGYSPGGPKPFIAKLEGYK